MHIDPGADESGVCNALIENLIANIPDVEPARGAILALLQMGPSKQTQGWLPKQFDHGICLLKEPIHKVHTFQARVVRLTMETEMWAARCRRMYPGVATGLSSWEVAADEYADEPQQTERKLMSASRMVYMGLPPPKMKTLTEQ